MSDVKKIGVEERAPVRRGPDFAVWYAEYLQSKQWAIMREDALNRFRYRCALCYSPDELEVHHRTYERLGDEEITDLVVLCSYCHGKHHDQLGAFTDIGRKRDSL